MIEKPIPEDTKSPAKYLRWRVDLDELAELSSLKMQSTWKQ